MRHLTLTSCWLSGSLSIWLLCAWVQQPTQTRQVTTPEAMHRPVSPATQLITAPTAQTVAPGAVQLDPETGLAVDKTLMLVKGNCTACHSSKLILQSHFDRDKWVERIRWMQRTQKLWDLGEAEPAIVAYLTTYYGPLKTPFDGRRLPLDTPVWHRQGSK